jgi:hypothetical protein
LQREGYAFNSSLDASEKIEVWATAATRAKIPDMIVIELAVSDGPALDSDRDITSATRRIVEACEKLLVHNEEQEAKRGPALLYFDSFFSAPSAEIAEGHCNRAPDHIRADEFQWKRAPLRADPHLCASYYYAGTNHDQITVPNGVPIVSYRVAVWPFLTIPPVEKYMAPGGYDQPQEVHERMAELLGGALISRARRLAGCVGANSSFVIPDSRTGTVALFKSEERAEGLCLENAFGLSAISFLGLSSLEAKALFPPDSAGSKGFWKFGEDRPGKPGWIHEVSKPFEGITTI